MAITTVGFGTHVGRKRSVNEDSYIAGRQVWAVADGMGGHAAGDVASAIAVARLAELDEGGPIEPSRVGVCIRQANADVLQHGRENPEAWGLGTTVSGICEVIVTDDVPTGRSSTSGTRGFTGCPTVPWRAPRWITRKPRK